MNNRTMLPADYCSVFTIDLQKNKKLAILINILCLLIAVLMLLPAAVLVPLSTLLDIMDMSLYLLRFGVMLGGIIAYIVLHELVHGLVMRTFSGVRPHYGFTGLYAYTGSAAYFSKKEYVTIALAPIVLWGLVLTVILFLVPVVWFWPVYIIQVVNISGAAGDLYVTVRFARLPADILVKDTGVSMTVYSKTIQPSVGTQE